MEKYGTLSIELLKQQKYQTEEITNFSTSLKQLLDYLENSSNSHRAKDNQALKTVMDLAENFVRHCCLLITEDIKNQDVINNLQATAIIVNLEIGARNDEAIPISNRRVTSDNVTNFSSIDYNLLTEQQNLLLDQLLLIKELWQIDSTIDLKKDSVLLLFHANILLILQAENSVDYKYIFERIVNFLINDHNVLIELTNAKLICLYNRIKDLCVKSKIINHILIKIHEESKFRKNFNKLNNLGYELLELFENYNTMIHQIENSEFNIVERFLLQRNTFMHEILINIIKHINAIRILNITVDPDLNYILSYIRKGLTQNIQSGHTISLMISSIESKFSSKLEAKIIKRYISLDSFTKNALKTRYQLLFSNISSLLKKDLNYVEFIQQIITCKIAADYKINNYVTSVKMLRIIEQERVIVINQLREINFVEIFSDKYSNKTFSLNFKKYVRRTNITTPSGYVTVIIRILLTTFSVEQLQLLSRFLKNGNLTTIQEIVQQELVMQVKKRTTIGKIIYYIFTRRKNELTILNNIKKSLNEYTNRHC
ncbi:hypothetical protein [Rickettsia endosymbiont of Oedothorax gibbosus]|uniref:hypothetical protein n=1 Tax=Rickettsia endosymbiont of Oedothorax gibbosus TaxID=931099 RepID=UPI00202471F9|nr:hypothetical protein [Rickettsia endosymbiont of Oedothorax gibbosus]